jgi:hypothetical protein
MNILFTIVIENLKMPVCTASIYTTLQLKHYYFLHLYYNCNKPAQKKY